MGYIGNPIHGCTVENKCDDVDTCGPNANCTNIEGRYDCQCYHGYEGAPPTTLCQDVDECQAPDVCGDNAVCINTEGSFYCQCKEGFVGSPPHLPCVENGCDSKCGDHA